MPYDGSKSSYVWSFTVATVAISDREWLLVVTNHDDDDDDDAEDHLDANDERGGETLGDEWNR
jgi:hypothetical protein